MTLFTEGFFSEDPSTCLKSTRRVQGSMVKIMRIQTRERWPEVNGSGIEGLTTIHTLKSSRPWDGGGLQGPREIGQGQHRRNRKWLEPRALSSSILIILQRWHHHYEIKGNDSTKRNRDLRLTFHLSQETWWKPETPTLLYSYKQTTAGSNNLRKATPNLPFTYKQTITQHTQCIFIKCF